ncbi:MAG: phosphoglycerate kinase [Bacteroidetes bacterium]|nr:phosphoglycerate kinase [Bacteroidota bacterium]
MRQVNSLSDLFLSGKRVLVRVDFNVPLEDGKIADDTRIRGAIPTIEAILAEGGQTILMSHLGRPKGEANPALSLRHVAAHLDSLIDAPVVFCDTTVGPEAEQCVASAPEGAIVLLENTRFLPGETTNDPELARQLAELADVFVLDAFGTVHRAHASTAGVAEHMAEKAAGFLIELEIDFLTRALSNPEQPFAAVLGGVKVSDKMGVIEALLDKVDHLLIGGAMAYTFLAAQGKPTGTSLVEEEWLDEARDLMRRAGGMLLLPTDHVVADRFAEDAASQIVEEIPDGWMGLDIGPETRTRYAGVLARAKTIIWNGPMGVFEMDPFAAGTRAIAQAMASATQNNGTLTVVGGGDSVAAINEAGLADAVSHVSTGGGAMLEFIEGKTLSGLAALEN